jgi:outer membrane protein
LAEFLGKACCLQHMSVDNPRFSNAMRIKIKMLSLRLYFFVTIFFVSIFDCARAESLSLEQALIKTSGHPSIEAARANLRAVEEKKAQALAGWKPSAYIEATRGKQDINRKEFPEQKNWSGTQKIVATQQVFSGGGTVALMNQADEEISAAREELRLVEQQILFQAITAFMGLLHAEELLEITSNKEKLLQTHYQAVERKFSLGEATKTDVAQYKSRLSRAVAEHVKAEGDLASAKASFETVVGEKADVLIMPIKAPELPSVEQEELQEIAQTEHPSILRQRYATAAAEKAISVSQAKILPSLALEASKTRSNESTSFTTGRQESSAGNIQMRLNVPLYQGGIEYANIRQSRENHIKSKQELRAAERLLLENLVKAIKQLKTAKANLDASRNSVEAATAAKEGMEREAQFGERTTLEVLDSIQELFETQINFSQAKRDEILSSYNLLAQIGRLNFSGLQLGEKN